MSAFEAEFLGVNFIGLLSKLHIQYLFTSTLSRTSPIILVLRFPLTVLRTNYNYIRMQPMNNRYIHEFDGQENQ